MSSDTAKLDWDLSDEEIAFVNGFMEALEIQTRLTRNDRLKPRMGMDLLRNGGKLHIPCTLS